jgi:hypothetical protein
MNKHIFIIFGSLIYMSVCIQIINSCYLSGMTPQYITSLIFASVVVWAAVLEYIFRSGDE